MNLGLILAMSMGLLIGVIPQLASTLSSLGGELPLLTRITIGLSNFLINNYLKLIVAVVASITVFQIWKKTPSGTRSLDIIKLKIPVISYFTRMGAVIQ